MAVRKAVIANRDTVNATLQAGGGRMWCCPAALAAYPPPAVAAAEPRQTREDETREGWLCCTRPRRAR